ncbi:MAG: GGDEF domain-containing protein [Candidatus Omnitrophota bacterium]
MHQYFIEKPASYNLERAERLATSIYQSFKKEITVPSPENIKIFINKYNDIPFLNVNFLYQDENGILQSVVNDVKELDILSAEYVYPIRSDNREIGTLLVYDINKEYKKGLKEYNHMIGLTRLFFSVLLGLLLSVLLFREYSARIEQLKRIAEYKAVHDGLTGVYTHKYFKEHLEREVARSQRYKRPISLIMCDIDRFKNFNDSYGHLAGDKAIRTVAQIISENIRTTDMVARYGGEEFAILLIETSIDEAITIAKRLKELTCKATEVASRIKKKIQETPIDIENKTVHVTISMGIASYDGSADYKSEYLISEADHALYQSKNNGRNLITLYNPDTKTFSSSD